MNSDEVKENVKLFLAENKNINDKSDAFICIDLNTICEIGSLFYNKGKADGREEFKKISAEY